MAKMKMWKSVVLLLVGLSVVLVIYAAGGSSASPSKGTKAKCIKHDRHVVAHSRNKEGIPSLVTAEVGNDGSCEAWLLRMRFAPFGRGKTSWYGGREIPAGGSLSRNFAISAQDLGNKGSRAFSGFTGTAIKSVEVFATKGQHFLLHPRRVRESLTKRYVWLRNLRYFVRYYPVGSKVSYIRVINNQGKVVFKGSGIVGSFEAP